MVLIGYFVYAEVRDRRKKRKAGNHRPENLYKSADPLYALDDNSQPISASPYHLNARDIKPEHGFTVDTPPAKVAPSAPARPPMRQSAFLQEDDESDLIGGRPVEEFVIAANPHCGGAEREGQS